MQGVNAPPAESVSGIRYRSWQELVRENLRSKPFGNRLGELTGSWLGSALMSGLISVLLVAMADGFKTGDVTTFSLYTWMAITAAFGSWAVLAVGKFCEGVESD